MAMNNGVMTMRPLDKGLAIEPGKTVKFAPGGYHLMLMDLKSPLKQGDKVPVTLEFEKAGKVKLSLDVQGVGAKGPARRGPCAVTTVIPARRSEADHVEDHSFSPPSPHQRHRRPARMSRWKTARRRSARATRRYSPCRMAAPARPRQKSACKFPKA